MEDEDQRAKLPPWVKFDAAYTYAAVGLFRLYASRDEQLASFIKTKSLQLALRMLYETEAMTSDEIQANHQSAVVTLCLRGGPFQPMPPFHIKDHKADGSAKLASPLYHLVCSAQSISLVWGCSIERAIEVCLTKWPAASAAPGDKTIRAIKFIHGEHNIPLEVGAIQYRYPGIDWSRTLDQLKAHFAPEIRKEVIRERGPSFDPGENLENADDRLTPFLRDKNKCQFELTKAAFSTARMFIHLPAARENTGTFIRWHRKPDAPPIASALELGRIHIEPFLAAFPRRTL